ncbi:MAG: 50S ribosomal protein L17 [Kiritimatiellae bacterium]|nr:50S ribosomal protein L17 [Kiritimatiellia bacterium]
MRHNRVEKKFGRSKAHREQLMGTLVAHLIVDERIETTLPKAKQLRRDAEKMVTLARKGTLAARRLAAARLRAPKAVIKLFDQIVPALEGRAGGYTRIVKTRARRGDAGEMAIVEWVARPRAAAPAAETPAAAPDAKRA